MGVAPDVARAAARLSLGRDTTSDEVAIAANLLISAYRRASAEGRASQIVKGK